MKRGIEKKINICFTECQNKLSGNQMTSPVHNMSYVHSFLFAVIPFGESIVTDVTLFVFLVN
jgi:hypothetical protein